MPGFEPEVGPDIDVEIRGPDVGVAKLLNVLLHKDDDIDGNEAIHRRDRGLCRARGVDEESLRIAVEREKV